MQRRTRLNRRQGRMPEVVDLTGDDGGTDGDLTMGVEPMVGPPAPQERPVMGPEPPEAGSVEGIRMQAVQAAQAMVAARSVP